MTRPTTGERGQPSDPVRLAVPALAPPRSGAMYAEALTRQDGPRPRLVRCPDAATEARLVTDAVLDALDQGRPLRTQAVLMRAAHHSDLLEVELTSRGRFLAEPALATLDIHEHRRSAPAPVGAPAGPRVALPSLGELFA